MTSDHVIMSDHKNETSLDSSVPQPTNNNDMNVADSSNDKDSCDIQIDSSSCNEQNPIQNTTSSNVKLWSNTLATPTTLTHLLSPTTDHTSLKHNQHGLGLKYAIDRSKILSRTGKGCSALLLDIASIHDELSIALYKCRSSVLLDATNGSPLSAEFINNINQCISSYVTSTLSFGTILKNDISKDYTENSIKLGDECIKQYTKYNNSRSKCTHSRKDVIKLRKRYIEAVKDVDVAINTLKKGRNANTNNNAKGSRKRTYTGSSTESYNNSKDELGTSGSNDDDEETEDKSWQFTLRNYGNEHSLTKQCESLIRATEEVTTAQTNYVNSVTAENVAVDNCVNVEKSVLDEVQKLEEERIVFLIGLFDRFLQEEKKSLESMSLDLSPASTEPLNFESTEASDDNVVPPPPSPTTAPTTTTSPSIFMSPRRRAGTDDGPAINETRMLNLPDNIADIRDSMKTTINKQLSRLKTIKVIVSFNDNMANAIESFAGNLKSLIENNPSNRTSQKNNVLFAWNAAMGSLEMYAKNANMLSKQIRKGNNELQQILTTAEKETKLLQEKEEYRWKSLCDASKVESKAKLKQKQYLAELEKAKARLTMAEGEGDNHTDAAGGGSSSSTSPKRKTQATTAMDQHMNKAMGKMFSILPSEGKDVMNKVLTPQQRLAIAKRQLDEAQSKETKGTESFEVAQSVKQQAVVSYETEAEACQIKFKEDERNEWSTMHQTLVSSVTALKDFRNNHLQSVKSSIDNVKEQHLQDKALEDVTRWTTFIEKRLKDQRDRIIEDSKDDKDEDGMFSLKVQLVECTNVEEAVRNFMEEDVDEDIDFMVDDDTASPGLGSAVKESNGHSGIKDSFDSASPLPDVPPDLFIGKMDPIFSKKLKNVSIEEYHSAGWSEEVPLYQPWLERKGSFDVSVSDWEQSSDREFVNDWSKEKFTHKRVIKFKFKRTTHLYIGPPIAGVTQTQYLIKEGNDKCVVMMTVEMDGIPYSDSFAVEVRWAARRLKEKDIAIDAGVIVRFTKSNMFASKIKSGTLKETSPIHLDLFDEIKSAIASNDNGEGVTDIEDAEEDANEDMTSSTQVESEPSTIPSKDEGIFSRVVASLLSLPKFQILLGVGVLYFGANMLLSNRSGPNASAIAELSHKVDDLSKEVIEMKAMLETVLKVSTNQSGQRSEL